MRLAFVTSVAALGLFAGNSLGDIIVTQTNTSGPVYGDHSVNFDEPGAPTGAVGDPFAYYQPTDGITFGSGNGFLGVEDWDTLEGIAGGDGDGNQLAGGFSIRMLFDDPIQEISWQGWADGSPDPPFGGINVVLLLDDVEVGNYSGSAPFGGVGDEWFNVVATGGDAFNEVRFFNGAFNSFTTYMDNVTWNDAPAPGALALLGVAGLFGRRRRTA